MTRSLQFIVLIILAIFLALVELVTGSVNISMAEIVSVFSGSRLDNSRSFVADIILSTRLTRVCTAILAGGGLSVAGLMLQTLFRNPLAGPGVLGISTGASLGVALVFLSGTTFGISVSSVSNPAIIASAAMMGAFAVLMVILLAASRMKDAVSLLIVGLMLGYLTSGVITILQYGADDESIKSLVFWGMGSFSSSTWSQILILALVTVPAVLLTIMMSKWLNGMLLGEQEAGTIGVNYSRVKLWIILLSSLLAGVITASCGPIAFLGLAVPHLARAWFRSSNHKILVPGTLLFGIVLALLCDLLSRMPWAESSIPLNAVTSFVGAPVVLWIILRSKNLQSYY